MLDLIAHLRSFDTDNALSFLFFFLFIYLFFLLLLLFLFLLFVFDSCTLWVVSIRDAVCDSCGELVQ